MVESATPGGSGVSFTLSEMHRKTKRSQDSKPEMETRTFTWKRSPDATSNNTNIGMLKYCWEFQHPREGRAFWGKAAGNGRWEGKFLRWTCHSIPPSEASVPCLPQGAVPIPAVPIPAVPQPLSPTHSKLHWVFTKEKPEASGGFHCNSFHESLLSGHRQQSPGHKSLPCLGSPFPELPSLLRKKK